MATFTTSPWSSRAVRSTLSDIQHDSNLVSISRSLCQNTFKSGARCPAAMLTLGFDRGGYGRPISCVSHLHFPSAGWAVPSGFMKYNSVTGEYAGDVRTSTA